MSLRLEIVSHHRRALGEHGVQTFGHDGGTIGRSLETDWSLPDQHRFLSSRHASIDYHSGAYYIVDTSRNGVYVNDSTAPVGRGNPQRLFHGDRIKIGDYEMTVSIDAADDTREVLAGLTHVDPVDLRQRVESPDPTGYELLSEEVITGVGIDLILEEDAADTQAPLDEQIAENTTDPARESAAVETGERPLDIDALPVSSRPRRDDQTARDTGAARTEESIDAIAAFCRGAGLETPALSADEAQALMLRIGELTRELVAGVLASLRLRSLQKSELRQSGTTIQPRDNNVLKFSPNAEEALTRLLFEPTEFYLPPGQSVRSAFADINEHQRVLLQAMQTALNECSQQDSPDLRQAFLEAVARAYGPASPPPGPERSAPQRRTG